MGKTLKKEERERQGKVPFAQNFSLFFFSLLLLVPISLEGCSGPSGYRVSEEKRNTLSNELETLRKQTVQFPKVSILSKYENFLDRYGHLDPEMTARAMKRMGDLQLEKAHTRFMEEMEAYERNPIGPPPVLKTQSAIQTYQDLLEYDPDYPENDRVLYSLSRALIESGKRDEGAQRLLQLLKQYPHSPIAWKPISA